MTTEAMHVVIGGDRPVPTRTVVHQAPRPRPTGLDWAAISPPTPATPPAPPAPRPAKPRSTRAKRLPHALPKQPARKKVHRRPADAGPTVYERLATAGLTSTIVRNWAKDHGVPYNPQGAVMASVLDAYLAAHPTKEGTPA